SNQQLTTNQFNKYLLTAGSDIVYTVPNAYAVQVLVGQSISGDGIPVGTVVKEILDNGSFTISNAATRTSYITGTTTNDVYLSFNANSTTVNALNSSGKGLFTVGQILNGYVGIADGSEITAVNGNTLTLNKATTTSDSLILSQTNNAWNINLNVHTFTNNFTYISPDVANVNLTPNNNTVWTFTAPNPRITVSMGDGKTNVTRYLNFGSASRSGVIMDFSGGNPVFDINPKADGDGVDTFNLYAEITNAASLTRAGSGVMNFYRPIKVDGVVTIGGIEQNRYKSTTALDQTAIIDADHVNIVGNRHLLRLQPRNILSGTNLLADDMPVNIYAGGLDFFPQEDATEQTVGPVTVYGRAGIANSVRRDNLTLTLTSLTRGDFGTVNLIGNNQDGRYLGNQTLIKISGNDKNIRDSLVGGGGADGSKNISIIPWATAQGLNNGMGNADSGSWAGSDLVTYTTAGGFRALTASEYFDGTGAAFMNAGATDNVTISGNTTITGDKTINALRVTGGEVIINSGVTLTVTSGLIGATNFGNQQNPGGTIDTGSNAAIFTMRRTSFNLYADLTNSITDPNQAGLIAANIDGFVNLYGAQKSYGGMTVVQTGLNAATAYVLPADTELRVEQDGDARISANNVVRKLSGVGWLTIGNNNVVLRVTGNDALIGASGDREVRINDGGILAPGNLTGDYRAGTLLLGAWHYAPYTYEVAMLTLGVGALFEVDISATANDMVESANYSLPSTLNLEGGTIKLNYLDDYTPAAGETDTLFSWTLAKGFDSVSGSVSNLVISDALHPEWLINDDGYGYSLLLDGNDLLLNLNLAAIPEPSTWALLVTGAALLAILRRRR
ncbi:MAG: PEP-CTERM sorting domain-containing protein, partial [Verrucomicrobiales bacterium]|nr:PEP-CTERM sorting domain-containing protein [Verrucomicrobiales bacterium]